jgi:hypothetical protein
MPYLRSCPGALQRWRRWLARVAIAGCLAVTPAVAAERVDLAGHYYLQGVMETGSELLLKPDGRFQWMLSYGALDQQAEGNWKRDGDRLILSADARPVAAPLFELQARLPWGPEQGERLRRQSGATAAKPGIGVVIGDPKAGLTFGDIGVEFVLSNGRREQRRTDRGGWALLPMPKKATLRQLVLRTRDPGIPAQVIDAGSKGGEVFVIALDSRAMSPPPFATLELDIEDDALVLQGGRGRYVKP